MKYKTPYWCKPYSERDIEIRFLYDWLIRLEPKTLIDIGFAGNGYIDMILEHGIEYFGLDCDIERIKGDALNISDKSVLFSKEKWRECLKKIDYDCADIENYYSDKKYDLAISISVIEHISYWKGNEDYINNIKALSDYVLLTFPCGIEKQIENRDILIYNEERINKIVGGWEVVEYKSYIKRGEKFIENDFADMWIHRTREIESLCCLLIKKKHGKKI